jgi:threonine dehydratase
VVGAEPELAQDAHLSLQQAKRHAALPPRTIADGLRTALGALNFEILNAYPLPIHLVSEADIVAAQKLAMSCLKVLIEPSSAVPIAALLAHGPWRKNAKQVAVIITGGNMVL